MLARDLEIFLKKKKNKCQYGRERYKLFLEKEKQRLVEYIEN